MRRATTVLIAAVALVSIVAAGLVAAGCGGEAAAACRVTPWPPSATPR